MQTKYIDFINQNGEFFQIVYAYGKGQFSVNLEGIFNQFSSRDFKKLLEIVQELSASPFEIAENLYNIVCLRLDHENSYTKKDDKTIKRIYGFLEQLHKYFGLEVPEDAPEKVTLKKSTVAARRTDKNGNPCIELLDGWTFKKCGYNFSVYKEPRMKERRYRVIISVCGLSVCNTLFHTKEAAVNSITEDIIQLIEENANNLKTATKDFRELMTAAGYDYILNNPIYADITTQEATERPETAETVNNTTMSEKSAEKAQEIAETADNTTVSYVYKKIAVKNLSQLKKAFASGALFRIVKHGIKPELSGQIRQPNIIQTNGIYTVEHNKPDSDISKANGGRGYFIQYEKAGCYEFIGDIIRQYTDETKQRLLWEIELLTVEEEKTVTLETCGDSAPISSDRGESALDCVQTATKIPQGTTIPPQDAQRTTSITEHDPQPYHTTTPGNKTAHGIRHDIRPHRRAHNVKAFYTARTMQNAVGNGSMIIDTS